MGLLVAAMGLAIIALAIGLYLQGVVLKELRNAHLDLAAEVGVVKLEAQARADSFLPCLNREIRELTASRADVASYVIESLDPIKTYAASLNERLVLLEIEKTAAPKPPEEPPPARRSFASQKARAEAGARK